MLPGLESRSGISRPNTLPAPTARTASAAQTELSMPPEIATTNPRRRSRCASVSTIQLADAIRLGQAVEREDVRSERVRRRDG